MGTNACIGSTFLCFSLHLRLIYVFLSIIIGDLRLLETIIALLGLILAATVSLVSLRKISKAQASIPSLSDFIKKGEDGVIIMREDLAMLVDGFGSRIAKSLKMSFLQGLGASAKIEKGLKSAIAQDIIEEKMPLVNLIGDVMGFNTKQYVSKHPEAIGQIASIAAPYLGGKGLNLQGLVPGLPGPNQVSRNNGVGYGA